MNQNTQFVSKLLTYTYGLIPIVAGLDKFTNLLTNWSQYLPSGIADMLPFEAGTFMSIVGIIEITAGIIVLVKPKIGSLVVMGWLIAIALTLIIGGQYDIAVRDIVMAVGAFSLFKLISEK